MRIYSLGYEGLTSTQFLQLLKQSGIEVVIDVRENPWSHKKGFSKGSMRTMLRDGGIYYIHVHSAGNPRSIRRRAPSIKHCLEMYDRFLRKDETRLDLLFFYLDQCRIQRKKTCIICFEEDPSLCHRSILFRRIQPRGFSIQNITQRDSGSEISSGTKSRRS